MKIVKRIIKIILIIIATIFALIMTSCIVLLMIKAPHEPFTDSPYMVDRTQEKDVEIIHPVTISLMFIKEIKCRLGQFLGDEFECSGFKYGSLHCESDVMDIVDVAFSEYFDEKYIDCETSKEPKVEYNPEDNIWLYCGGETYAAFCAEDGEMICCMDTRIQSQLYVEKDSPLWHVCCEIDLCSWDIETVHQLSRTIAINGGKFRDVGREIQSPQAAFDVTVDLIKSVRGSMEGEVHPEEPEMNVFFISRMNSWIVVGKKSVTIIDKDNGIIYFMDGRYKPRS